MPPYVKRFEDAANKLVVARLLLRDDADRLIARAKSDETVKRFAASAPSIAAGER